MFVPLNQEKMHTSRCPQPSANVHYAAAAIFAPRVGGSGFRCRGRRREDVDAYYNR